MVGGVVVDTLPVVVKFSAVLHGSQMAIPNEGVCTPSNRAEIKWMGRLAPVSDWSL